MQKIRYKTHELNKIRYRLADLDKLDEIQRPGVFGSSLAECLAYPLNRSHLKQLEVLRGHVITFATAVAQSSNSQLLVENEHYDFLANRLALLNFLINQERKSRNLLLEDPNCQPLLNEEIGWISNPIHFELGYYCEQGAREILHCSGEWFPESVDPALVDIIKKCNAFFAIEYCYREARFSIAQRTDSLHIKNFKAIFNNIPSRLTKSFAAKAIILEYFDRVLAGSGYGNLYAIISSCVEKKLGIGAMPSELPDFKEGMKELLQNKILKVSEPLLNPPSVAETNKAIPLKKLKELIDSYKSTARFFTWNTPELDALRKLYWKKYTTEATSIVLLDEIKKTLLACRDGKTHRIELLEDPRRYPKDTTGQTKVIRALGNCFSG